MKKLPILSMLLMLSFVVPFTAYSDSFKISPKDLVQGEPSTLEFTLENSQNFYGFQATVSLPDGITPGNITLSERAANSGNFNVTSNVANGILKMAAFSSKNTPFSGNNGVLVTLEVKVSDNFSGGEVKLSDLIFTDSKNMDVKFADSSAKLGVAVTDVTFTNTTLSMEEGQITTFVATVHPAEATDQTVTWASSNPAVASVSSNGVVTAIKAGTAIITAASSNGKTETCTVTVTPKIIEATAVTLSQKTAELKVGETATLTAIVAPDNTTDKTITWSSNNNAIVTVNTNGKITAIALGEATITATCGSVNATCKVTVIPTPVESITLSNTELNLTEGDNANLIATIVPADATDKSVTLTSSDDSIVSVTPNGEVTAVKAGTATITATSSNGKTATCTVSVAAKIIPVTGIAISDSELNLTEGETATLTATITPTDATDKTVDWTSFDESIATVSANGEVTAVKAGTVTITASSSNGKTETCTVTVAPKIIEATAVTLSQTTAELKVGETVSLTATVAPDETTDKTITWASNNEAVATVDINGKVSAIALGEATITATCGAVSSTCKVTVIPTPVESITLSNTSLSLTEGDTATLTATIAPADATDKTVTWTSSDASIATVSANGEVTAVKAGIATITVTSSNGKNASCTVSVDAKIIPVTAITINKSELSLTEEDKETLVATITPTEATDKSVTWTSSDASVATVSANGEVTAIKAGTATITASSSNGKTVTCTVTVAARIIEASAVTLSQTTAELKVGETVSLTATVAPDETTDKTLSWTSSNEAVATVDTNGKVSAIALGEATITATCGSVSANCKVTVVPTPVENITLSSKALSLIEEETATLIAIISPSDATDKTVTWTSSDYSIATVSAEGVVTAVKAGTATITAASSNGKTATCSVSVAAKIIPVTGIAITNPELNLTEGETEALTVTINPDNATDQTVTWTSSDESIATVSANGEVTAVKAGTAIITAASSNGKIATCLVIVNAKPEDTVDPDDPSDPSDDPSDDPTDDPSDPTDDPSDNPSDPGDAVDQVWKDPDAKVDIYNMTGTLLKRACTREDLNQLTPGIYILRQPNGKSTVFVHR